MHAKPATDRHNAETDAAQEARSIRRRRLGRGLLAGPLVFLCAAAVMVGGALWVPAGKAGIDNLILPIVLFPAIWALLFFYACLDRHLLRAWLSVLALLLLNAALIAGHFLNPGTVS